jgi:glyoxylase-like metal-dependent hydrolase (beta-lactamase superfamily II)
MIAAARTLRLLGLGLWIMGVAAAQGAASEAACPTDGWLTLAPGIHIWQPAPDQDVSEAKGGHVMPTSVLVHEGRAWVIDPGPSLKAGQQLKALIACRWQARVERVFNTHAHAENVLANIAFLAEVERGEVSIGATQGTRDAMAKRCADCLADLTARIGVAQMAGTDYVVPDAILSPGEVWRLGPHGLRVHEVQDAHTLSDLVLVHETAGVVWVGGLAYGQRLPELAQGSLMGWRRSLAWLQQTPWTAVVGATVSRAPNPGEQPQALQQTDAYLRALQLTVLEAMESGLQVSEITTEENDPFASWTGFEKRHGFNLQRAWRELEPSWMDGVLKPER